ncbi:MAG: oligosaccharyltransferase complex subunit epsilon [Chaenotheca gracillima]|nr:MAG: oligosaccharyltransferase complex subunit epsilon [Chaenotheca gracillima]
MSPPTAIEVEGASDTTGIAMPNPLTANGVSSRRAKVGKLTAGVAAWTNSDNFKSPAHGKPKARRWDHRLTLESKSRKPSSLKGLGKYLAKPGMISLGGGLPSSDYFPIESLDIKVPSVPHFTEEETKQSGITLHTGKHDASEGKGIYDLSIALNYGQGMGSAQVLRFVTEHTEVSTPTMCTTIHPPDISKLVHNPPYDDWGCTLTVGSTSALELSYRMFTNRGEYIMSEEYTFATAVETAAPLGVKVVGIRMDDQGLLPEHMDEVLKNWDPATHEGAPKPFLLYTVPSGQNPTGATQGIERRKAIYATAQKHDVYIIEDEPYYFLQMQPYTGPDTPPLPPPKSHDAFLKSLVPSLLSMDTDGRVMRMDSFSKVIAPGSRVGWITASDQIVERIVRAHETSTQNPSGISQLVLYKLLDEGWGHEGYLDWLINLRLEYTKRRDTILHACETYLPSDVVSWNPPAAGMFLWMKINWRLHPKAKSTPAEPRLSIEESIFEACFNASVLLARGSWFRAEGAGSSAAAADDGDMFFRATFAAASSDKMVEAIRRFGEALKGEFKLE